MSLCATGLLRIIYQGGLPTRVSVYKVIAPKRWIEKKRKPSGQTKETDYLPPIREKGEPRTVSPLSSRRSDKGEPSAVPLAGVERDQDNTDPAALAEFIERHFSETPRRECDVQHEYNPEDSEDMFNQFYRLCAEALAEGLLFEWLPLPKDAEPRFATVPQPNEDEALH